jgi:hypothetical protein
MSDFVLCLELISPPAPNSPAESRCACQEGVPDMDLVMIAIGVFYFALSIAYLKACDTL